MRKLGHYRKDDQGVVRLLSEYAVAEDGTVAERPVLAADDVVILFAPEAVQTVSSPIVIRQPGGLDRIWSEKPPTAWGAYSG